MKFIAGFLLVFLTACSTISTPPPPVEVPAYSFVALRGAGVQINVLDQRGQQRDAGWEERVRADVSKSLAASGVVVSPNAPTRLEIRILRAQSDLGGRRNRQWNGCIQLAARLSGSVSTPDVSGDACITQFNEWGVFSAKNALHQAYEDALVRLMAALDKKL